MLHRLAWVTTLVIGLQMILGAIIVGRDAGFACPNWPLCGKVGLPPLTPSLILELVHRFSALLVTVLVLWTVARVWLYHRQERQMFWTATWALISLLLQVVVGGLIVIFTLPGVVTTIDVINSMALLALFVHLSNLLTLNHKRHLGQVLDELDPSLLSLRTPAWIAFGSAMTAVLVGALFRHTGASQALFGQDSYLLSHDQHVPPSRLVSDFWLILHVTTGGLAGVGAVWFAGAAFKAHRLTTVAVGAVGLVVLQAMIGVSTLVTQLEFALATLHWTGASVLIGYVAWILSMTHLAPCFATATNRARMPNRVPDPGSIG
jgi:cytochrome c oxidase assembly protein subunit 15